jgi:hypothetical protein
LAPPVQFLPDFGYNLWPELRGFICSFIAVLFYAQQSIPELMHAHPQLIQAILKLMKRHLGEKLWLIY